MVYINYAAREFNYKIVYCGIPLSGKSTNMKYIYDDDKSFNQTRIIQIPFRDEGGIGHMLYLNGFPLGAGLINTFANRFHFYTIPGKGKHVLANKMLLVGVDGIVFVYDSHIDRKEENYQCMEDLRDILKMQQRDLEHFPLILQLNKRDLQNIEPMDKIKKELDISKHTFESIATTGMGIRDSLKAVMLQVIRKAKADIALTDKEEHLSKLCPYCGEELRSSKAKQCRKCKKDWHDPNNIVLLGT